MLVLRVMPTHLLPLAARPPWLRERASWISAASAACLWLCLCEEIKMNPLPLTTLFPRLCSLFLAGASSTILRVVLPGATDGMTSLLVASYPAGLADRDPFGIEHYVLSVAPGATTLSLALPQAAVAGRRVVVAGLDRHGCIRYSAADVHAIPPIQIQLSPRRLSSPLCPGGGP